MREVNRRSPQDQAAATPADPCVMVIFGAAGDLTRRKLIPALYNLAKPAIAFARVRHHRRGRGAMSTDDFRKKLAEDIKQFATGPIDAKTVGVVLAAFYYIRGDFDDKNVYPKSERTAGPKSTKITPPTAIISFTSPRPPIFSAPSSSSLPQSD